MVEVVQQVVQQCNHPCLCGPNTGGAHLVTAGCRDDVASTVVRERERRSARGEMHLSGVAWGERGNLTGGRI